MQGSRRNKIHPTAIVRSVPAVFPQHSYPHPRETRGIPAVPIPVHTSTTPWWRHCLPRMLMLVSALTSTAVGSRTAHCHALGVIKVTQSGLISYTTPCCCSTSLHAVMQTMWSTCLVHLTGIMFCSAILFATNYFLHIKYVVCNVG